MARITDIQDKIYQKMSAKKKLEILIGFYRTGKYLNNINNEKLTRNRTLNLHRQST